MDNIEPVWIIAIFAIAIAAAFIRLIWKKVYGYGTFICTSCGETFKYQHLKASNCPNCGILLEKKDDIDANFDGYHSNHSRL